MDQYIINDFHTAMAVDGLATSRPVVAENVTTPTDINALFDDITYEKAGCVIRMVNQFTGEEAFRLGLKVGRKCLFLKFNLNSFIRKYLCF